MIIIGPKPRTVQEPQLEWSYLTTKKRST
jgi:hypothetical protein